MSGRVCQVGCFRWGMSGGVRLGMSGEVCQVGCVRWGMSGPNTFYIVRQTDIQPALRGVPAYSWTPKTVNLSSPGIIDPLSV